MAYQWYNEQREDAKDRLSVDYVPEPGKSSQFPPGVDPVSLAQPKDHSAVLATDAFQKLEAGNEDVDALIGASSGYNSRFAKEPLRDVKQISTVLGPSEAAAATGNQSPNLPLGQTTAPATEDTPEPLDAVGQEVATGVNKIEEEHTDPRNDSGRLEKGSVFTGIDDCIEDAVNEIATLIKEIALFIKDSGSAALWYLTDGYIGSEKEFKDTVNGLISDLKAAGQAGIELIAACDIYYPNIVKMNPTFSGVTYVLKQLFTDSEWSTLARDGRSLAEQIVNKANKEIKDRPHYVAGYVLCQIVTLLNPRAFVKILKSAKDLGKLNEMVKAADGPGHRPDQPDPKNATEITKSPQGQGNPTPQGGTKDDLRHGNNNPNGPVSPDYVPEGTDGSVGVPSKEGMPNTVVKGSMSGIVRTRDELVNAGVDATKIASYMDEVAVAKTLQDRGYHVKMIDDPLDTNTSVPNQELRAGDYPYDSGRLNSRPDTRVNGVIFDIKKPDSAGAMMFRIEKTIEKNQTQNFIIHVAPKDNTSTIRDYLKALREAKNTSPQNGWFSEVKQVILVDQRTGEVLHWHR